MNYSKEEVLEYIKEDDVRFIRLAFCDFNGKQKNIAILPSQLERAFNEGISFDASAIAGFTDEVHSDLFLHPIPSTLTLLPWRSMQGKVVRMFCEIRKPDGSVFEKDCRSILKNVQKECLEKGYTVNIGSEVEFYLFKIDEKGEPTKVPFDKAGYMDVAPEDKGENVRREICQYLNEMGIIPEASHHEEGPGQNEIDFRYSGILRAADNVQHFISVVKAVADKCGLYADFSPKPLADKPGNGFHINISITKDNASDEENDLIRHQFMAGVLAHAKEITAYLNSTEESYARLGSHKAPKFITWSNENRSQLIRLPAAKGEDTRRMEVRSADPMANPYSSFALLIKAGLDGIEKKMELPPAVNDNLFHASEELLSRLEKLPSSLEEAKEIAENSEFVKKVFGNK